MKRLLIFSMLLVIGGTVGAASFDCTKAASAIEKSICSDDQISGLDSQLMLSYKKSMSAAVNAEALKLEQRAWLANVRNKCQDAACLKFAYADRIAQLDASSRLVPVQTAENVPAAIIIDQPKANEPPAVAAAPSESAKASVQSVVVPQSQKVEPSPQVVTPAKPATVAENSQSEPSTPKDPGMGTTDIFRFLFSIGMIALLVGIVRPSLANRWVSTPTRKKIFGIMLIYLIPIAALTSFTRTPERIAYDASVKAQKEAERLDQRAEQERQSGSSGRGGGSRYQNEVNRFVAIVQRAKSSGAMSNNPSCEAVVEDTYGSYSGSMQNDLQQARSNDPSSSNGILAATQDTAASQLSISTSNIANLCFNGQ